MNRSKVIVTSLLGTAFAVALMAGFHFGTDAGSGGQSLETKGPDMNQPVDQAVLTVRGSGAAAAQLSFQQSPINLDTCKKIGEDAAQHTVSSISCLYQGKYVAGFHHN